jgi:hypothetical protein
MDGDYDACDGRARALTDANIMRIRRKIAAAGDWIAETGHDVVFIPMHQAPGDDDTAARAPRSGG